MFLGRNPSPTLVVPGSPESIAKGALVRALAEHNGAGVAPEHLVPVHPRMRAHHGPMRKFGERVFHAMAYTLGVPTPALVALLRSATSAFEFLSLDADRVRVFLNSAPTVPVEQVVLSSASDVRVNLAPGSDTFQLMLCYRFDVRGSQLGSADGRTIVHAEVHGFSVNPMAFDFCAEDGWDVRATLGGQSPINLGGARYIVFSCPEATTDAPVTLRISGDMRVPYVV